jgi:hypothetical protein
MGIAIDGEKRLRQLLWEPLALNNAEGIREIQGSRMRSMGVVVRRGNALALQNAFNSLLCYTVIW